MKTKAPYIVPKFQVRTNCIIKLGDTPTKIFNKILNDYCTRFKVQVVPERQKARILLCLVAQEQGTHGLCISDEDLSTPDIMVQVQCPIVGGFNEEYSFLYFSEILVHEMVHACQILTGREGFAIPEMDGSQAGYFFEPCEIEARVLQAFYAHSACQKEMNKLLETIDKAALSKLDFDNEDDDE